MAKQFYTLSLDSIKLLTGLIRDLASVSEGIDNLHLADDKTFSNIHIKDLIDKCLQDANTEAEKLVGALTHLTCEETTVQPTLDNSEVNVIYLYSADGNAPYQQYLKISDTKLVDLGNTSISLTDYIKAADVAKDYATKTELKAVTDKIGTTTLTTTAQTLTGSIEEVKGIAEQGALLTVTKTQYDQLVAGQTVNIDGKDYTYDSNTYYVVKDDSDSITVTNSISSSSTDSEVPTALAVEKRVKNMLVCPNNKSPKEFALENCKAGQVVEFVQWGGTHVDSISQYATYKMIRGTDANWSVLVATIYDTDHRRTIKYCPYDGYREDGNKWKKWQRVVTTTVEDVPWTNATATSVLTRGTIKYRVKNGICYVTMVDVISADMATPSQIIVTGLPKPEYSAWHSIESNASSASSPSQNLLVRVNEDGSLTNHNATNNVSYFGSFSYPVAES